MANRWADSLSTARTPLRRFGWILMRLPRLASPMPSGPVWRIFKTPGTPTRKKRRARSPRTNPATQRFAPVSGKPFRFEVRVRDRESTTPRQRQDRSNAYGKENPGIANRPAACTTARLVWLGHFWSHPAGSLLVVHLQTPDA